MEDEYGFNTVTMLILLVVFILVLLGIIYGLVKGFG